MSGGVRDDFFVKDVGTEPRRVRAPALGQGALMIATPGVSDGFGMAQEQQAKHGATIARERRVCTRGGASPLAAIQKSEPFEKMDVLLVLQQRAMQGRNQLLGVALAQRFGRNILVEQQFQ